MCHQSLELWRRLAYNHCMSDPTKRPISDWLADLEISEAQAAAGDFVSGEEVLADLQASIARLEAKQKNTQKPGIASRR